MRKTRITAILAIFLLLSCAPAKTRKKRTARAKRTERKTAVSRTVGHYTEVTLRSAAAGAGDMLHRIVGNEMDKYDREQLNHVYERGISGQTASWTNPEQGTQYRVTPRPAACQGAGRRVCRKADISAMINMSGEIEQINTTACRAKNGQWLIRQDR
jgi:surface antigen